MQTLLKQKSQGMERGILSRYLKEISRIGSVEDEGKGSK